MKKTLIAITTVVMTFFAFAARMQEMNWRIPLMEKAPVIDGVVDKAEWAGAHGAFGFVKYPTDTVTPIHSEFFVGRTKDRLYLAGTSEIAPAGLKKRVNPRKGNVACTDDDNYEIVLIPDRTVKVPDIRHMIINYNGAYRTQTLINNNMAAWIPESMEIKSSVTDNKWHFEWSVKLEEIGFTPENADKHAIRYCRNFKNVSSIWGWQSSMRPNESGFFASGLAVPSTFDDEMIAAQLVEMPRVGQSHFNLALRLHNPTAKAVKVDANVIAKPVNSQPAELLKSLELKAGESVEYPLGGSILGDEKIKLLLNVKADGKQAFFREVMWNPNAPTPPWLKAGDDGSGAQYKFAFYPSYNKMRLKADLATIEAKKRPASVKVTLKSDVNKGKNVLATTELKLDKDGVADIIWECPDLKAETEKTGVGGYSITFEAAGVKNGKKTIPFRRDVFAWEGFKGGLSDAIPSMFKPIEEYRDGFLGLWGDRHVKTVLKDHTIDEETGLWKQVMAEGKPILARPISLISTSNLQPSTFNLSTKSTWDVDGMMEWFLTLKPGHYEPMTLEIPICAERAKLLHPCADGMRFNYAGVVPAGEGVVWDSSKAPRTSIIGDYLPYIWVGGSKRGIAVFGESDRGWVIDSKKHCQDIVREKDGTVVIRLNLIQKPVEIKEAQTIHLGFLATPVKPMEKNWRSSPIGGLIGSCYYWGGLTASDEIHPYDGTDTFWRKMAEARRTGKKDEAYIKRSIRECLADFDQTTQAYTNMLRCYTAHHNSGMGQMANACGNPRAKYVWYTNGRGVRLGDPEGATFADEWTTEEFSAARPFEWRMAKSYSLDPCKSYLDYAAYWWEKALGLGVVDYYYWDDIFCQSNFDLVGTESYKMADGSIQPAGGIFNQRAQVRRCAVLQAEHGWIDHKNWVHMTNTALAPVLAFAGANYDWEDTAGDTALQERYPKESIQAQSLGRQFGNQVSVMGYFATKDSKSEKLKWLHRTGAGACLAHEIQWTRVKEWREANELITKWGYRKPTTEVWNYFDEDIAFPVEIKGGENAALAMTREEGGSLIIISDFNDGGDYSVKPDQAVMKVKDGFKAYNLETGKELKVENGAVKVHLDRLDYVIIEIK